MTARAVISRWLLMSLYALSQWCLLIAMALHGLIRRLLESEPTSKLAWATAIDESSGCMYYYHTLTGAVTWEPPSGCVVDGLDERMRVEDVGDGCCDDAGIDDGDLGSTVGSLVGSAAGSFTTIVSSAARDPGILLAGSIGRQLAPRLSEMLESARIHEGGWESGWPNNDHTEDDNDGNDDEPLLGPSDSISCAGTSVDVADDEEGVDGLSAGTAESAASRLVVTSFEELRAHRARLDEIEVRLLQEAHHAEQQRQLQLENAARRAEIEATQAEGETHVIEAERRGASAAEAAEPR